MKKTSVLFAFLLVAAICFAQEKPQDKDAAGKKTKADKKENPAKPTDIVFDKTIYDFGDIPFKGEAKVVFVFKNVSSKPIALTNVKASCGCTTPEWSKEPIKKHKKGQITVTYDTQRIGNFSKSVSVFTDRQDNPIQLQIKGNVLPPAEGTPEHEQYKQKQDVKNGEKKNFEEKRKVTSPDNKTIEEPKK